jgi:hypothetical protein
MPEALLSRVVSQELDQVESLAPPKVPVGETGMWQRQIGVGEDHVVVPYEIEIQRAWRPPLAADPTALGFDDVQMREQLVGSQARLYGHHLIEVGLLRESSQWRGFLFARRREDACRGEQRDARAAKGEM